jgi:5'-3' exonuclease
MKLLVDSASLWYRAFYGMPDNFKSEDGLSTNAIKGFIDGFSTLVARYRPTEIGICLDGDWRPSWRVELFPAYKANRVDVEGEEEEPDLLTPQIEPLLDLLQLAGLSLLGAENFEADDVIATLAYKSKGPVRIASGDRDLFQLLRYGVDTRIIYLAKGIMNHDLVGPDYVANKYAIPFDRYHLFAAIRGDASDGLPGIKGIGEKGAAEIVNSFASMKEIILAAQEGSNLLKPIHQKKILADLNYAKIAEELTQCAIDVPLVSMDLANWREQSDLKSFRKLGTHLGLGSSVDRMIAALDI